MWDDTTLGDDDVAEELVQPARVAWSDDMKITMEKGRVLFVVTDGELQVTGDDTLLLVITGRVASKLKDLSSKVFEDGIEVDWRWMTNESVF